MGECECVCLCGLCELKYLIFKVRVGVWGEGG